MPIHYIYLLLAIVAETIGTTALQASQQFSRFGPSVVVVISYGIAFYLLAMALRFMPVGVAYAIWSGLGIVLIALIGLVMFGQKLDLAAIIGLGLIIAGIAIIQLFSNTATH
ncbi:MAG: multidrug efflux SMR transporter [Sedimentitalea sp.]|uniref:DMT family transporter n=1 Tax=Sedimentitalea sp. TaxID=2048915 RepID=UPI003265C499